MVVTMKEYLSRPRKMKSIEKKENQKLKTYQKLLTELDEQEPSAQSAADKIKAVKV